MAKEAADALGFVTTPEARDADRGPQSTHEWKVGFARRERMRAFGIELAKLLS